MVKVLIVDDEPNVCDLMKEYFLEKGCDTDVAYDGEKALEILSADPSGIMILDIKMPGMGGIEVLKEIQRRSYRVGVIVISGMADIETAREAMRHGALDYLVKPFNFQLLASTIDFAIKKQRIIEQQSVAIQ